MIGGLILVSVVALLGMLAYTYSVRSPISLSEYTDKEIDDGVSLYLRWVSRYTNIAPFGTIRLDLEEDHMLDLGKIMNVEFASAVSRHTKYPLYLKRSGSARIKFKKA